jgi:small subunit ribosomal protein S9
MIKNEYIAVGRRKSAIARVRLRPGTGKIIVNKRPLEEYFGRETSQMIVRQPLEIVKTGSAYDIIVTVQGGGPTGQAGAIRHGLSRALTLANPDSRPVLKSAGFLTRDPRRVERKKYGLRGARRAFQFSKR